MTLSGIFCNYRDIPKTPWRRIGWVIPPRRNADCAAGMERVPD